MTAMITTRVDTFVLESLISEMHLHSHGVQHNEGRPDNRGDIFFGRLETAVGTKRAVM